MTEIEKTIDDLHELQQERGPRERAALDRGIAALRAVEKIRELVQEARDGEDSRVDIDQIEGLLP